MSYAVEEQHAGKIRQVSLPTNDTRRDFGMKTIDTSSKSKQRAQAGRATATSQCKKLEPKIRSNAAINATSSSPLHPGPWQLTQVLVQERTFRAFVNHKMREGAMVTDGVMLSTSLSQWSSLQYVTVRRLMFWCVAGQTENRCCLMCDVARAHLNDPAPYLSHRAVSTLQPARVLVSDQVTEVDVKEAERQAQSTFVRVKEARLDQLGFIEAAKKRQERIFGTLNAGHIEKIENLYGKSYHASVHYVEATLEKWIVAVWLLGLTNKHGKMTIKTRKADMRDYLHQLTYWRFMDSVWFGATDYDSHPWFKPAVQYYRALLFEKTDDKKKETFYKTIVEVLDEHM
ncbi:MAG: hypothetical protein Q9168_001492 [Polycauliona sp. 1 TL-2023]